MKTRKTLFLLVFIPVFSWAQTAFTNARVSIEASQVARALVVMDSCVHKNYYADSALFYSALLHLKIGQVKQARKKYEQLSKFYPQFSERHYLNGLLFFSSQNYGKSIDEFNLAAKSDSHNPKLIYNRALAFGMLEEYLSAIEDLGTCIALNPRYTQAYYSRGYWYEYTGNYVEAAKDYESVIRLDPKNYEAYIGLAYVYQVQNETDKACKVLATAVKQGSQTAEELQEIFCK